MMTTYANVWIPSTNSTMSIRQCEKCRASNERTWVYFCRKWNWTSLTMAMKASHTTSCEAIFSPSCTQWRRWIPIRFKGWLQIQFDTPKTKKWEKPNLMCNVVEKTYKRRHKKWMIGWVNNQVFALGPTHNLKHAQCDLGWKFKRMLMK
jgi:hypothetical protein